MEPAARHLEPVAAISLAPFHAIPQQRLVKVVGHFLPPSEG
jgi:hypothetical protein